jgi:hypothetical protein
MSVVPVRPTSIRSPDPFGAVDFQPNPLIASSPKGVPSGDIQFIGPVIIPEPTLTTGDQNLMEMIQFRGSPLSVADQMAAGVDAEKMNALMEDCSSGKLSVSDLATELMIMMINNAHENKAIERQMRAELAQVHFENDMEIAKMIKEKGELAFKKVITGVVTKVATTVLTIAAEQTANYIATRKTNAAGSDVGAIKGDQQKGFKYTPQEQEDIRRKGQLAGKLGEQVSQTVGEIIGAELDLDASKLESQIKIREAMNKLNDSIANSVESSIRAQEQAIQFAAGMLDKICNLAHDTLSRIIGNMR